ncbi:MAG TPA: AAA family ATPase [Ktedonobacteraceae bacterium]|nr:AAA family ATPase [Ktedonobacteraceae bacterium]
MSIPRSADPRSESALIAAHTLVDLGVPVFRGRLDAEGNPDGKNDKRWSGWQNAKPSHRMVDMWKPGEALCAVTGYAFDVLDYDPRNGGQLSFKRLSNELGEDGPEIYWTVHTPSGGQHLYIASLGIGKHTGFLPGLDLQGGRPDGTSRGFVFLPPTIRPSKVTQERAPYHFKEQPQDPDGDPGCEALRSYISEELGVGDPSSESIGARESMVKLRAGCIQADAGGQRAALLRYVHERERQGMSKEHILEELVRLVQDMPVYDKRRPWYPATGRKNPAYHLRGLFHREGAVIPDASPEELDGLKNLRNGPKGGSMLQWVHDIDEKPLSWLWYGRIAFGEMTLVDGEKGKGKSFITYDIIARATRGWPMPGEEQAECDPITVMLFTEEGGWDTTIRPRLRAAGADISRVARVSPSTRRSMALPEGAKNIGLAIKESRASLAIFDPITDMLGEKTQSHNDASVRMALGPLAQELSKYGCAGFAIRHFNKAVGAGARNRGSGSTAFQNRARVHAITGELPQGSQWKFGIAIVDTNLTSREGIDGVIGYNIVDSDVATGDRQGTYHGRVEWGEVVAGVDANILADGGPRRTGPSPIRRQEVVELLAEMFDEKDTWPAGEVIQMLKDAGASVTNDILRDARHSLGIRTTSARQKGKIGVSGWVWTTAKIRSRDGED